ncbi:hypothetical protein [Melioribacter sp. OK-6-Me]|uniref:hypothetical protein n=1 Tax=unclassified Melioribacter TaxID=2627329 RepID=UPI003ED8C0E9
MELDLITDIHKYCDNWCDRCIYTTRCELFIETIYKNERKKVVFNPEGFFNVLRNLFAQAYDSFDAIEYYGRNLMELSELYAKECNNWLAKNELLIKQNNNKNADILEALEVIHYYQYFILLKLKNSYESDDDEKLIQLKLAEVAISRSISAWYLIFKVNSFEDIGNIIGILKSILILLNEENKELKNYFRPYFD